MSRITRTLTLVLLLTLALGSLVHANDIRLLVKVPDGAYWFGGDPLGLQLMVSIWHRDLGEQIEHQMALPVGDNASARAGVIAASIAAMEQHLDRQALAYPAYPAYSQRLAVTPEQVLIIGLPQGLE